MSERKVTAMDVAQSAGVSQSAVSRVFTPGASVSGRMAARVRAAAEALGYRPNVLARSLITGRSRIVGLVVAYLDNQFYPEALERLSSALQAEGYHILVFLAAGSGEGVDRVIDELLDYQVDGIITASIGLTDELTDKIAAAGIPLVLFNRDHGARFPAVTSDNVAGGRKVADFLVAGGHRKIAHIAGWLGASTARDREAGLRAGLAAAGLALHAHAEAMFRRGRAERAARAMLSAADPPDAIFVANDHMAFAVMDLLRHGMGLSIPGDVSVVGYDDVAIAGWPAYDLTTVRQPARRMVEATVAALLARIERPGMAPDQVRIDGPLVVRGTARVPAAARA